MSLATLIDLGSTPAPRRPGRPRNAETPGKPELQAECATLMVRSNWPVKRIAACLGISRMTAYRWKAEHLASNN
jgi:transposase-like protein